MLGKMRVPLKVRVARDLAGALPLLLAGQGGEIPTPSADARPVLGISVCHFERLMGGDTAVEARRNAALCDGLERFLRHEPMAVRIFCLNTHPRWGDAVFSQELAQRLSGLGVEVECISARDNMLGCWRGLASCRAVLSARLHGAITAYVSGVPFALVEYHRKCADFLDDIGQPAELRIAADCDDPAVIEQILTRLFRSPEMPRIPRKIYIAEAAQNFTQVPWA
jgi:polysaccharide pyruvyl transferase WcaK-like protein